MLQSKYNYTRNNFSFIIVHAFLLFWRREKFLQIVIILKSCTVITMYNESITITINIPARNEQLEYIFIISLFSILAPLHEELWCLRYLVSPGSVSQARRRYLSPEPVSQARRRYSSWIRPHSTVPYC